MTLVNLTEAETVATLILTAALTCYDPGTPAWVRLHEAADEIRDGLAKDADDVGDWLTTDCIHCDSIRSKRALDAGDFAGSLTRRMIVCPDCGSKRCPKAAHHDNPCASSGLNQEDPDAP